MSTYDSGVIHIKFHEATSTIGCTQMCKCGNYPTTIVLYYIIFATEVVTATQINVLLYIVAVNNSQFTHAELLDVYECVHINIVNSVNYPPNTYLYQEVSCAATRPNICRQN